MVYEKYPKDSVLIHIDNVDMKDPYTSIGSKVFLSCKNVYEIKLPDTICEIGDWAFAHMKDLKRIIVPANSISIGREAFLDCKNLQEIVVYPDVSENKGLPYLLASCITVLKVYRLLDFKMASTQNKAWCELYDAELINYIRQPDDSGFQPYIVGWFNDEGEEEQLKRYIENTKLNKFSLCFLRLKYDLYVTGDTYNEMISYIKGQLESTKNETNFSWKIFRDELSDDIQYVKIAVNNNLLTAELRSELISHINKRNGNPEIVAYLLSLEEERQSIEQIFEL